MTLQQVPECKCDEYGVGGADADRKYILGIYGLKKIVWSLTLTCDAVSWAPHNAVELHEQTHTLTL